MNILAVVSLFWAPPVAPAEPWSVDACAAEIACCTDDTECSGALLDCLAAPDGRPLRGAALASRMQALGRALDVARAAGCAGGRHPLAR
jgi:hypothetical protein